MMTWRNAFVHYCCTIAVAVAVVMFVWTKSAGGILAMHDSVAHFLIPLHPPPPPPTMCMFNVGPMAMIVPFCLSIRITHSSMFNVWINTYNWIESRMEFERASRFDQIGICCYDQIDSHQGEPLVLGMAQESIAVCSIRVVLSTILASVLTWTWTNVAQCEANGSRLNACLHATKGECTSQPANIRTQIDKANLLGWAESSTIASQNSSIQQW